MTSDGDLRGGSESADEVHIELAGSEDVEPRRRELVARALKAWASDLMDVSGNNTLLKYKHRKAGTLDLSGADNGVLANLLAGKAVRASRLFADPEQRLDGVRRLRTIAAKARENFEERGIETLSLACGLASWDNKTITAWEPSAPVLLRQAQIKPLGAARDDFEIELLDEMVVNPTLVYYLKSNYGCEIDTSLLDERLDGAIDEPWELEETYRWLAEQAARVPAFAVTPTLVLANFAYAKLPMVRDMELGLAEFAVHDLIAAIAGDEEARERVRAAQLSDDQIPSPDSTPLADEFLVLDADATQNWAINAVLAGESLIVRGPPGTGKSQTIANLISTLIARDKKVLFVAEKRAAIDAVMTRLRGRQLGDLVLDMHGGAGSRRAFAQMLGQALDASRKAPRVDGQAERAHVEERRTELNAYVRTLHEPRQPWGVSVYELRVNLQGLAEFAGDVRFLDSVLDGLDQNALALAEEMFRSYARLGGFTLRASGKPWSLARIEREEQVQETYRLLDTLRRERLPQTLTALEAAAAASELPPLGSLAEWKPRIELWQEIAAFTAAWQPAIFNLDLASLQTALAPARNGGLGRLRASLFGAEYKQARTELRTVCNGSVHDGDLLRAAEQAQALVARWRELGATGVPAAPANVDELVRLHTETCARLAEVGIAAVCDDDLAASDLDRVRAYLDRLADDRGTLTTLPELHRLKTELAKAGLGDLHDSFEAEGADADRAAGRLHWTWSQTVLDRIALTDRRVDGFDAAQHQQVVAEFVRGDKAHIASTAARIRRLCAERAADVRDQHRDQSEKVEHQARLKRGHKPVRDLVRDTTDVLLALKPCWALSPLMVSQILPASQLFDVVIFDEASQVTPADAMPSILRGNQLVVAGDEKQLPPTSFFASGAPDDEDEEFEAPEVSGVRGFESILDSLGSLLRFRMLGWHYRSRDERLIAFSNAHIYDRQLTTFPGVGGDRVLDFVLAPHDPASNTNSPTPEVEAAVELVLEHARTRPNESLGVITMGKPHADRIEETLWRRLREEPELEEFFAETRDERFFVKSLERVQGDERHAIILSIGYGKDSRGNLLYRFGPLLSDGGERRLNVAVTRAKSRLTLISSFTADDMPPEKSNKEGVILMRRYLQYIASNGTNLGDVLLEKPELNPFEVDVRDTLARQGLRLLPQYGCSGYWIDYAVEHPDRPGRLVLAIECDGASYHSSQTARDRDRLRQEQLERLGWRFHRIWSTYWFRNKDRAVAAVLEAYRAAIAAEEDETAPEPEVAAHLNGDGAGPVEVQVERGQRPRFPGRRDSIEDYSVAEVAQLVRWIESDQQVRTRDALLAETVAELGFQRRGGRIVRKVEQAIDLARR